MKIKSLLVVEEARDWFETKFKNIFAGLPMPIEAKVKT